MLEQLALNGKHGAGNINVLILLGPGRFQSLSVILAFILSVLHSFFRSVFHDSLTLFRLTILIFVF